MTQRAPRTDRAPFSRRAPRVLAHLAAAGALSSPLGCQGEIGDPPRPTAGAAAAPAAAGSPGLIGAGGSGGAGVGGIGAGVGGALEPDEETRQADDVRRAEDPDLFEVATQYFPGQTSIAGPKRVFRLTRRQLDATTRGLLPGHVTTSVLEALPRDPLQTNYEYADNLSFNAANFAPYTQWADAIAVSVRAAPATVVDCVERDRSCLESSAREFVRQAFRGATTAAQLTRYSDFFLASVDEVGLAQATADLVSLALTSPSYVFRDEVQTLPSGDLLAAHQLQNITYTLADAPPGAVGLSIDSAEALVGTPTALAGTVDSVLATAQAREKLSRFFLAWLEVREPDEFTIAEDVFPEFTPEVARAAVADVRAFLEHRLFQTSPKLQEISQATQAIVSDAEAFLYGNQASGPEPVELDTARRFGIFTQPGVIASHSGPTTTRLVKRGVFFTRKVMCLPLGVPPAGVDTTIPEIPNATERQKIESITSGQPCIGCHAFINPFGFMQENYDAIGRWRDVDEGQSIDASVSIDFLDEGPLTATTPVEALRGLTRSYRFQQCFARQLFRFYMGRDEESGDDPMLRQMFFDFASQDQQDIVGMMRVLAGSRGFLRRRETL